MINLFKKNIYSFLSLTTTTDTTTVVAGDYNLRLQRAHQPILGLGLINATRVANRSMNVLESTMLKHNNNPSLSKGIGFIDGFGGEVDGLMSCTESLGSESSGERHQSDQQQQQSSLFPPDGSCVNVNHNDNDNDNNDDNDDEDDCDLWRRRTMMRAEGRGNSRKMKSFPPPLSWLNRNGKPSFILRPVRKDGRLELTKVRIQRPEILHASRHDGRLTLHLIPDHSIEEEEELDSLLDEEKMLEEEEEVDATLDEEIMVHEEEVDEEIRVDDEEEILDDAILDKEITVDEKEEEEEEEERVGMGSNEGLRRCYEMVNQHHHHVHGSHHHHHHMRVNICVPC